MRLKQIIKIYIQEHSPVPSLLRQKTKDHPEIYASLTYVVLVDDDDDDTWKMNFKLRISYFFSFLA